MLAFRVLAATASIVTLVVCNGCSPVTNPPVTEIQLAARTLVAADLRGLLDAQGLVVNPGDGSDRPIDLYGSAWLLTLEDELDGEGNRVNAAAVATEVDEIDRAALEVPPQWRAWAWSVVSAHGGATAHLADEALAESESLLDGDSDVDDAAVVAWAAAGMGADHVATARRAVQSVARSAQSLSITGTGHWHASCRALAIDCSMPALTLGAAGNSDPGVLLDIAAAADLVATGIAVAGYHGASAVQTATRVLASLPPGNDVIAARMTHLIVLEGGDLTVAREYLDSASERRDPATGLYRGYVTYQGTISTTYEARRALGTDFDEFISEAETKTTVTDFLSHADIDDATTVMAIAILTPFGEAAPAEFNDRLMRVESRLSGTHIAEAGAAKALVELRALADIGRVPIGVEIQPIPLGDQNERLVCQILQAAFSGILANADEIITYYADYTAMLPEMIIAEGPGSIAFIDRLAVLDYLEFGLGEAANDMLVEQVATRVGCGGFHALASRDSGGSLGCDVGMTAELINTRVGMEAIVDRPA